MDDRDVGMLCLGIGRPKRRKRSKLRPKFWTMRVRCMRHVLHDSKKCYKEILAACLD